MIYGKQTEALQTRYLNYFYCFDLCEKSATQEQQQQQRAQSKQQLSICIYVLAMPPEGRKMSARTLKMIYNGKVSQKERGKG